MHLRDELVQTLIEMSMAGSESVTKLGVLKMWQQYIARFSSLLAPALVNATLLRSVEKNGADFPWLLSIRRSYSRAEIFKELEDSLAAQLPEEIERATRALLSTHIDMLVHMVGTTLTAQYICSLASQPQRKD